MYRGSRRQGPGIGILLLGFQIFRYGIDRIPPVTLSVLVTNVLIFLRLIDHQLIQQPLSNVCLSALHVWNAGDYSRILLSSFFHFNDWHLYYNMASFLWKGISLENRIGSIPFLYMIGVFTLLSNIVYVMLALAATEIMGDSSYVMQCAIGFSGVLFALKVVTTHYLPSGTSYIMGLIPVPMKYAVWAELFLIHFLAPGTSFLGHLAGIIVGTLYTKGPLHDIMDIFISTSPHGYSNRRSNRQYSHGSGYSGYSHNHRHSYENTNTQQPHQYNQYTGGLTEEQQLSEALRRSQRNANVRTEPSAPPLPPEYHRLYPELPTQTNDDSVEEMRRRRLHRFQ